MQVTRITIENLRAVERRDIDLSVEGGGPRRRVLFLGANGAGKTTLLDALVHAFMTLDGDAEELGARGLGAGDVRNQEASLTPDAPLRQGVITLEAILSERERRAIRYEAPNPPDRGTLRFMVGHVSMDDLIRRIATARVPPEPQEGSIDELALAEVEDLLNDDNPFEAAARGAVREARPPCVFLPADRGVLDYRDDVTLKQITAFDPRRGCLSRARERFAPLAARLAFACQGGSRNDRSGNVARMWKVLAKYFPEMPQYVNVDGLLLWFKNGDGSIVPLPSLSDGERAVLLIFAEVALRAPEDGVVLVDEIEQHLHPRWQRAALEGLAALVPHAQFIFTTQSPYVAASAPDDCVEVGDWKRYGE
jgi:predicted ATPase